MNVSQWAQNHRRSILFLFLLLALGGVFAALQLPVSLFPQVAFPRVVVALEAGDQPARQMEMQVTRPVEEAVRSVPGVETVRSTTSRGSAEVSLNFGWGTDMGSAALQVSAAISQILPQLPPGTRADVRRMDPTKLPIIAYSLTSATLTPTQLRDVAEYQLRPLLSSVNGVARVQVKGGAVEEYRVTVNPDKLHAFGLALDDVAKALATENVLKAVGRLEDRYKLYLVVADTRLKTLQQMRETVLASGPGGVVRLEDVATVNVSVEPQWVRVTADGKDAVLLNIYQQPGGNSVQIAKDVQARLAGFQGQLPAGVQIASWYDQSTLVTESAASVRDAILIGIGLAALVLLVFLRNLKIMLIAILVVPAVLAATVVLLQVLGMSFNIMTLGGMAAAVGLIVDDAVVMVEHIVRRLRGAEGSPDQRVMRAAREFFQPLIGSSASTIIIFLPLAFLTGVTGAFFKALSITMASALFVSFVISWLAVPILAGKFLNQKDANQREGGRLQDWVHARYRVLLGRLLDHAWIALLAAVLLVVLGGVAFRQVGSGFMPAMDEGGFVLDYHSAPGTSLTETDRLLRQVEDIIRATPDVAAYSRRTGTQMGGGLTEANQGDFFITLKSGPRRPVGEIMADIRGRVESTVPGLSIEMAQLMEDLIGDLTSVPQPIEVKLYANDPAQLPALGRKVAELVGKIGGVVDVKDGLNPAGDALQIHVDRVRAALEGMDPDAITKAVSDYLSGNVATQVATDVKVIGVRVWVPQATRATSDALGALRIRAPDGHSFALRRVATFETVTGEPEINRENLRQMQAVTGRIEGRDLGSTIVDVKAALDAPGVLPQGAYYELGGVYQQQQIAFHGLIAVFAAAAALVFFLLLFLYESFRLALAILTTSLLAVTAVFAGLWLTGIELNITAMMGMTMIIGIVTEVAIFYFSEQQELAEQIDWRSALIEAGVNRMRPIAMTTVAAILTLLPLAFAIGTGSQMQQPLAVAIIAGLVVQLPLVLLVMPVLFNLMHRTRGHPTQAAETPSDAHPSR
ncbi:efflux RND transporter permease subunit [Comamonas badia]|uniref:efflux RND transporter permease subunit n=1 Tax=Comamonas badia TaxID=265291 RepID=UPI00041B2489|nr:efflux RND transporter permease subunit [Comamonas badia]